MSDDQPVGEFIRERRLALGFSAGQLAMRLGSTAAIVRSWERGQEPVPSDVYSGLAELLDVEPSQLTVLAGAAEAVEEKSMTRAAKPPDTETKPKTASKPEAVTEAKKAAKPKPEPEAAPAVETEATADRETAAATQDKPAVPDPATNKEAVGHTPGLELEEGLLDAPTEAIEPVPAAVATATRPARTRPPARSQQPPAPTAEGAVEPAATAIDGSMPRWLGPLVVIFDPTKRYLYWARWVGTFIGLLMIFRVLHFSLAGLVDAVGEFWDSFRSVEPAAEETVTSFTKLG